MTCKDCENWYPYLHNNGQTGMCSANYKHNISESMWTCRNFEKRCGKTYFVDTNGKQVSDPFYL